MAACTRQEKRPNLLAGSLTIFGGDAQIRTGGRGFAGPCLTTWPRRHMKRAGRLWPAPHSHGADNGARTRDPHLGKVVLYQLSHVRVRESTIHKLLAQAKQNRKLFLGRVSARQSDPSPRHRERSQSVTKGPKITPTMTEGLHARYRGGMHATRKATQPAGRVAHDLWRRRPDSNWG